MSRFISLPWKVLALTMSAMLAVAATLTSISLLQIDQEFEQRQQEKRNTAVAFYDYLQQVSVDKRRIWLESLSTQHLAKEDYPSFDAAVQRQFDLDELRIDSIWLLNPDNSVAYASGTPITPTIKHVSGQVQQSQSEHSLIYCQASAECFHVVAMPVLVGGRQLKTLISRASLNDLLYTIVELNTQLDLAIVKLQVQDKGKQTDLSSLQVLTSSHNHGQDQAMNVLKSLPVSTTIQDLENSVTSTYQGKFFVSYMFALQAGSNDGNFLLLMEDITDYRNTYNQYQTYILFIAAAIFLLVALFVYVASRRSSRQLLNLANDLPLLAEKRFDEFRSREHPSSRFSSDELDILTDSASGLADELEDLHLKIEQNTRELENIAMYDLLTGLPNRNMLNFQLKKCLATLTRQSGNVAVLFLDLDDFKKVNDSHGHDMGDVLLEEAARRLRAAIRDADIACRFGGDEFVIVLPNIMNISDVQEVANKLLAAFKTPVMLDGRRFYVSTSVGAAIAEDQSVSAEDLIRQADMAMYEAKDNGGNCLKVYDAGMYQRVANRVMLESEVREAISDGQFSLSLQPQIEIETGKLFGFEALLRWKHPKRGMVSPDEFIPVLENSKHMIELGYWVISHSFELLNKLNKAGYEDIRIAINLSAGQFVDPDLSSFLKRQLRDYDVPASSIELELTERTLVEDMELTLNTMHELRDLGFAFSIDDFGTGYSSLSYLKKMPVDCIKIDKCFVSGMLDNQADMQIVMSTIAMVRNLGMKVTAEGVENRAQLRMLMNQHCDLAQGYLFSRPICEHSLLDELKGLVNKGMWVDAAEVGYQPTPTVYIDRYRQLYKPNEN